MLCAIKHPYIGEAITSQASNSYDNLPKMQITRHFNAFQYKLSYLSLRNRVVFSETKPYLEFYMKGLALLLASRII